MEENRRGRILLLFSQENVIGYESFSGENLLLENDTQRDFLMWGAYVLYACGRWKVFYFEGFPYFSAITFDAKKHPVIIDAPGKEKTHQQLSEVIRSSQGFIAPLEATLALIQRTDLSQWKEEGDDLVLIEEPRTRIPLHFVDAFWRVPEIKGAVKMALEKCVPAPCSPLPS